MLDLRDRPQVASSFPRPTRYMMEMGEKTRLANMAMCGATSWEYPSAVRIDSFRTAWNLFSSHPERQAMLIRQIPELLPNIEPSRKTFA